MRAASDRHLYVIAGPNDRIILDRRLYERINTQVTR
jgi:hypothetical protein